MSFIERVKQTRDELMSEKEQVLTKIKYEIEQNAKYGHSTRAFGTWDFKLVVLDALGKETDMTGAKQVDKYFELMNYVIKSLSAEGFEVGYNCNEAGFHGFYVKW